MSSNAVSPQERPSKNGPAPHRSPLESNAPENHSRRVAALQAMLRTLGMQFKDRTAELEMQVLERQKTEGRLRELTSRILHLQDDQARRIARELHDSAGQYLAAIQMNLSALGRETSSLTDGQAKRITDSIEIVICCTAEIRTISYLLHPPLLDEMGLASALAAYADGFAERSDVKVELDIPKHFGRLPSDIETAIFRIVQQSLANIHRHSGSRTARIKVRLDSEEANLRISDEGHGISPEILREIDSGTRLMGVGIAGMRERAVTMNGSFHISSGPHGTTIEISLPIAGSVDCARR
jgi:two-component system NarL family sensor kinase